VNKTASGFGTKGVTSQLEFSSMAKFTNSTGGPLNIVVNSKYGNAWENYFTEMLSDNVNLPTSYWNVSKTPAIVVDTVTYYTVTATINNVDQLEHTKALVSISIADISI